MMPLSIFSVNLLSENLLLFVSVLVFAAVLVAIFWFAQWHKRHAIRG